MVEHAALVPDKKGELDARGKTEHLKAVEGENLAPSPMLRMLTL